MGLPLSESGASRPCPDRVRGFPGQQRVVAGNEVSRQKLLFQVSGQRIGGELHGSTATEWGCDITYLSLSCILARVAAFALIVALGAYAAHGFGDRVHENGHATCACISAAPRALQHRQLSSGNPYSLYSSPSSDLTSSAPRDVVFPRSFLAPPLTSPN